MTSTLSPGFRSPARSEVSSPRLQLVFDPESLKVYTNKLLSSTLGSAHWPGKDNRERVKNWIKDIGERVKQRMVEIQPKGFKYIVLTQINENLGQGGRADLACHWEDSDVVLQEMFVNDSLICICIAFAVRTL